MHGIDEQDEIVYWRDRAQAATAARDALAARLAEVEKELAHAKEFISASKECATALDMLDLVEDNERFRAAFRQIVERYQADPKSTVRSVFCSWCNEQWPQLEGESVEAAKEYARRHASQCKTHPLRVERDTALRERDSARQECERLARVADIARRVVSRGIHRRNDHRDVMLREVTLLPNDIVALAKLAEAVSATTPNRGKDE